MDKKPNVIVSLPVFSLLGLIFVTLKLLGAISWSWLWVLAPFWGPVALALLVAGGFLAAAGIVALLAARAKRTFFK